METTEIFQHRTNHAVVTTNGKDKPAKEILKTFDSYHAAANYLAQLGQGWAEPSKVAHYEIWSSDGNDFSKPRYAYN